MTGQLSQSLKAGRLSARWLWSFELSEHQYSPRANSAKTANKSFNFSIMGRIGLQESLHLADDQRSALQIFRTLFRITQVIGACIEEPKQSQVVGVTVPVR